MNTVEEGVKPLKCWFGKLTTKLSYVILMIGALALVFVLFYQAQKYVVTASRGVPTEQTETERARMSDEISVQAAGQGNPWINLSDGREVITPYSGLTELTNVLEENRARPLSLCSADFDEDGVPDLISGYAGPNGGIVTLLRGNVDAIYSNSPEAKQRRAEGTFTDAPFLSPAFVFGMPEAVDFAGAGDFDGDSHWDVVAAKSGSNRLYLLSGDGKGGLALSRTITLEGDVTALVVGEINRRDGLNDIVVGIGGEAGARALVFEGPEGALKAKPEEFTLPVAATSLALGQLDDKYEYDLVIAAGKELMIVSGRDRKLSLDAGRQATVKAAEVSTHAFAFEVHSIAIGDFKEGSEQEIALLCDDGKIRVLSREDQSIAELAKNRHWREETLRERTWSSEARLLNVRTSSIPLDNLLVMDKASRQLDIAVARMSDETLRAATGKGVREYPTETLEAQMETEAGAAAVLPMRLNNDALSDLVIMKSNQTSVIIAATEPQSIFTVTNTNDSGAGSLRQAILDADSNPGADTVTFNIPGGVPHTIKLVTPLPLNSGSLSLDATTQPGFAGRPVIELKGKHGELSVQNSVVRGFVAGSISGGVNSVIEGNFIGTDVTGTLARGNGGGAGAARGTLIGGTTVAARNIISGNDNDAIQIRGAFSTGNLIQGNYIGTDVTGTIALPNGDEGVDITEYASNNLIGGTVAGAGNVISGNSGNSSNGVSITAPQNLVQGNYIGLDKTGKVGLGNKGAGVVISSAYPQPPGIRPILEGRDNTIGGTTEAARNVVSGNTSRGVVIISPDATGNLVQGNFIGTDATGTASIGNSGEGVFVSVAPQCTIGGTTVGARNLISGNGGFGIGLGLLFLDQLGGTGTLIEGNYVGTDVSGVKPLGNGRDGVFVNVDSKIHTVRNNAIAFNNGNGVNIPNITANPGIPGFRISISGNAIFSNSALGINLGDAGVTVNDIRDPDAGANELQNFPVLTSSAVSIASLPTNPTTSALVSVTVSGTFNSTPNSTFTLEFFLYSTCPGTGQQSIIFLPVLLGSREVTTDANGNVTVSFTFTFPEAVRSGFVNATATSSIGNTSEFSQCITVSAGSLAPQITSASRSGKKLLIIGENFDTGAAIFINGEKQKTFYDSGTNLTGKKSGKTIKSGDKIKVKNSDGTQSNEYAYP